MSAYNTRPRHDPSASYGASREPTRRTVVTGPLGGSPHPCRRMRAKPSNHNQRRQALGLERYGLRFEPVPEERFWVRLLLGRRIGSASQECATPTARSGMPSRADGAVEGGFG